MNLYRIISFPNFVNLIENKKERYVQPIIWEDTHEAYMLRLLEDSTKRKDIIKALYNDIFDKDICNVIYNYFKLWSARWRCYGQCWSKTSESDALWRIYSYDKMSIRIETTDEEIEYLFNNQKILDEYQLILDDVKYDFKLEKGLQFQIKALKENKKVTDPFFHKREAFKHENEKRVILFRGPRPDYFVNRLSTQGTLFNFYKNNDNKILTDLGIRRRNRKNEVSIFG